MKKVLPILMASCALIFISCESTKQAAAGQDSEQASERAGSTEKETKKEASSSSASFSSKSQYKKILQDAKISVVSSPKETSIGKAFSSPYKIQAANQAGEPLASFKITAEYPESKNNGNLNFAKAEIVTDEKGLAEFSAPTPKIAANASVHFYPAAPSSDPDMMRMASQAAVEGQWKVRTNLGSHTGILVSVVDYRQNGNINIGNGSQPSAQALTSNLWRSGLMGAQNADFHNSVDADDPVRIRNDALKQLNGNSLFKFVVYGRVKYASEITKDADGYYSVTLSGDLGALKIDSGEVLVKASKTVTAKDKSEWKVIGDAQQEMAKLFCEELIYTLYN